jgi:hypothetical protein
MNKKAKMENIFAFFLLPSCYNTLMVNPFDRSFFKFFIGFVCILCFSFGVLFVVGYYSNSGAASPVEASK